MTTKSSRINATFEKAISNLLADLAIKENKSTSKLVRELTINALEMREDMHFSDLAEKLDHNTAKTYSHNEAWQ